MPDTQSEEERRRQCLINPSLCTSNQRAAALVTEMMVGMGDDKDPGPGRSYSVAELGRAARHILKHFTLHGA